MNSDELAALKLLIRGIGWRCARLTNMACVLCGSVDNPTDEDVIPKWLLRAFDVQEGSTTLNVREESGAPQEVRKLRHFQFTLNGGLCKKCNNERLAGLEQAVQPVLEPMAVRYEQTVLNVASQRLLAAWAVKTVYLLELPAASNFPARGWWRATSQPPQRSAGCWPNWSNTRPGSLSPRRGRWCGWRAGIARRRMPRAGRAC